MSSTKPMSQSNTDVSRMEDKIIVTCDKSNIRIECEGEELHLIKEFANTITIPTLNTEKIIFPIMLGVEEVDGLKCESVLALETYPSLKRISINFIVASENLTYGEKQNYKPNRYYYDQLFDSKKRITHIDLVKSIIHAKYLLSNLKYCYTENALSLTPKNNQLGLMRRIFENPNIKMKIDICSVCHIETLNKTPCNHTLCFKCWECVQPHQDEDGDDTIPCPMCRKDISRVEDD